jgi:hypothetical protein
VLLAAAGLKGRRQRSNRQRAYRRPRQKADSKIRPVPTLPLGVRFILHYSARYCQLYNLNSQLEVKNGSRMAHYYISSIKDG